ncbi:hypothetical protein NDU88_000187 [Pleurodeles waltl]|uniref:Uncharacterized protein n=1 Tax=Pleurodeles waltl TaxID=8319 RepID=A0AAV7VVB1_PLEWA|nr:hypothetical protein NDU88_000187 [Pleurodeles waltl]
MGHLSYAPCVNLSLKQSIIEPQGGSGLGQFAYHWDWGLWSGDAHVYDKYRQDFSLSYEPFSPGRLMTPRPIRSEDGRDVRGRRGGKAEARTKRGVAAGRLLVGLIPCGKNKRY